jgi:hypothetical protein
MIFSLPKEEDHTMSTALRLDLVALFASFGLLVAIVFGAI